MAEPRAAAPLEDFPFQEVLRPDGPALAPAPEHAPEGTVAGTAPPAARLAAFAADAATVLLLAALALLAAHVLTGQSPRPAGVAWALGFVVYLSLFTTVVPLVLFGRTVGMAISELSARSEPDAGIAAGEALRRWAGTLATAATAGLPLLWTRRRPDLPTPADRLSGRPLRLD